jgi:hypothetical protein
MLTALPNPAASLAGAMVAHPAIQPTAGTRSARAAMIPAVLAPVTDILATVADVLASIPDVFPPVADVFQPVPRPAVMPGVPAVLAAVADVFPAVTHLLAAVTDVLAPIPDILAEVSRPLPSVTDVLSAVVDVLTAVVAMLLQPLLAPLNRFRSLGVILEKLRVRLGVVLLEPGRPVHHDLAELLRVRLPQMLEFVLTPLLKPVFQLLEFLRVGFFEMGQPLAQLGLALLDGLLEGLGILLLQLLQPLHLLSGLGMLRQPLLPVPLSVVHALRPIADVLAAVAEILAAVHDILAPVADVFQPVPRPVVMPGVPAVLAAVAHVLAPVLAVLGAVADIFAPVLATLDPFLTDLPLPPLRWAAAWRWSRRRPLRQPKHPSDDDPEPGRSHGVALLCYLIRRQP